MRQISNFFEQPFLNFRTSQAKLFAGFFAMIGAVAGMGAYPIIKFSFPVLTVALGHSFVLYLLTIMTAMLISAALGWATAAIDRCFNKDQEAIITATARVWHSGLLGLGLGAFAVHYPLGEVFFAGALGPLAVAAITVGVVGFAVATALISSWCVGNARMPLSSASDTTDRDKLVQATDEALATAGVSDYQAAAVHGEPESRLATADEGQGNDSAPTPTSVPTPATTEEDVAALLPEVKN